MEGTKPYWDHYLDKKGKVAGTKLAGIIIWRKRVKWRGLRLTGIIIWRKRVKWRGPGLQGSFFGKNW